MINQSSHNQRKAPQVRFADGVATVAMIMRIRIYTTGQINHCKPEKKEKESSCQELYCLLPYWQPYIYGCLRPASATGGR